MVLHKRGASRESTRRSQPPPLTRCTSSKPLVPQALSCLDLAMFAQWSWLMVLWLTLSSIGVPIAR